MRKSAGKETWHTLLDWDRGQASAERMAAQIILIEGYNSVDPSHPLGGPDGLKDIVCERDCINYVTAAYFPRGQKTFTEIKNKFSHDIEGVSRHSVKGFIFITNQELTLVEREQMQKVADRSTNVEIYHLERLATILNSPRCYGIRLDFLDIEMTKEEQLSFIAFRDNQISVLIEQQKTILNKVDEIILGIKVKTETDSDTLLKLKEFRDIINQITGGNQTNYSYFNSGHVNKLAVPLAELVEFKRLLDAITGNSYSWLSNQGTISGLRVPLKELNDFSETLLLITAPTYSGIGTGLIPYSTEKKYGRIADLEVPLKDLKEYENTLNRIVIKLKEKRELEK